MSHSSRSLLPGIILIVIGSFLLLNHLEFIELSWSELYPILFLAIGLFLASVAIRKRDSGAIFWGTVLTLSGILFCLRNYGLITYYYMDEIWPAFLVIVGFAFFMLFAMNPRDWGVLIPACITMFIGLVFIMRSLEIYWLRDMLLKYWPLILILIGVVIIWESYHQIEKELHQD